MDKIYLKNIKIYAYHGCMEEEKKIKSDLNSTRRKQRVPTASQRSIDSYFYRTGHPAPETRIPQRGGALAPTD